MTYRTYYRSDISYAWRFTTLRSGSAAASDRSLTGGETLQHVLTTHCRTPQ